VRRRSANGLEASDKVPEALFFGGLLGHPHRTLDEIGGPSKPRYQQGFAGKCPVEMGGSANATFWHFQPRSGSAVIKCLVDFKSCHSN
jgi:hypothetical protein